MSKARPVHLNLMTISFPVTAIASICHRVSAVIVWIGLGFLLTAAATGLSSAADYKALVSLFENSFLAQCSAWGLATAAGYYVLATLKHLIQDMGFFEDLTGGRAISWAVLGLGLVFGIYTGVLMWA